jgi:hypothetical protein
MGCTGHYDPPMANDEHRIEIDLSWTDETEHQGAREAVPVDLLRAGWVLAQGDNDRPIFSRSDLSDADFERELAQAQYIVGKWLVTEQEPS